MRPLIADGAMGTELLARSGHSGLPAELNLAQPDLVRALHAEYVAAGARLLVANTLGATPGQASTGVHLAISACHSERSDESSPSVGSTACGQDSSSPSAPQNDIRICASVACVSAPSPELLHALFGADVLLLETVIAIPDLEAAVEAIRKASEQPIWATFSFDAQGELDGMSPREVARRAQAIGLQAFGYGCGFGLDASRLVLEELRTAAPHATLIAKPNLGLPRGGRYDVTLDQAARWAAGVAELGIRIVGLCCGSTPAHIRAIASKLEPDC